MPDFYPYDRYQQQAVSTLAPGELITLLYDRTMFHINTAVRSIESKRPGDAHASIRKAQDIITYLRSILDFSYPVSKTLERYYGVIAKQLSKANIKKDTAALEDAVKALRELRDVWRQIGEQTHKNAPGRGGDRL